MWIRSQRSAGMLKNASQLLKYNAAKQNGSGVSIYYTDVWSVVSLSSSFHNTYLKILTHCLAAATSGNKVSDAERDKSGGDCAWRDDTAKEVQQTATGVWASSVICADVTSAPGWRSMNNYTRYLRVWDGEQLSGSAEVSPSEFTFNMMSLPLTHLEIVIVWICATCDAVRRQQDSEVCVGTWGHRGPGHRDGRSVRIFPALAGDFFLGRTVDGPQTGDALRSVGLRVNTHRKTPC